MVAICDPEAAGVTLPLVVIARARPFGSPEAIPASVTPTSRPCRKFRHRRQYLAYSGRPPISMSLSLAPTS